MKEIVLRRRNAEPCFTIVDDGFYPKLNKMRWHLIKTKWGNYVSTHIDKNKQMLLHRYIMELALGRSLSKLEEIDHIDKNQLNNQLSNLRLCTRSQNAFNTNKHRDSKKEFKGINFDKRTCKWTARICVNYQTHQSHKKFENPIDAAKEYDLLAIKYAGKYAHLNFEEFRQDYIDLIKLGWEPTPTRTKASKYPGITYNKSDKHSKNPWAADFWEHGKKILHVGHFATEEEAVTERDLAAIKHFGEDTDFLIFPRRRRKYIEKIQSGYDPKTKRNKSSKYIGVNFQPNKKSKPWRSYVERNKKRIYLGDFATENEANEARLSWLNQH